MINNMVGELESTKMEAQKQRDELQSRQAHEKSLKDGEKKKKRRRQKKNSKKSSEDTSDVAKETNANEEELLQESRAGAPSNLRKS